jgi:DNA-binding transcriptional regulator YhcF (GntR family)
MKLKIEGMKPIYLQIAEWLETEILNGAIGVNEKIYSQYQLAEMYNINPATAAKGLTILAEANILYKKRGLGMFVSPDAAKLILNRRKNDTLKNMVIEVIGEAHRLGINTEELITLIKELTEKGSGLSDVCD